MTEFNYPDEWKAFWEQHRGAHSMLRCPGDPCPGGCGASAKDALAELVRLEQERKSAFAETRKLRRPDAPGWSM